jgi:hypothetical protein
LPLDKRVEAAGQRRSKSANDFVDPGKDLRELFSGRNRETSADTLDS